MKIIRAKGGEAERKVDLADIRVPDLWHLAEDLRKAKLHKTRKMVLETWYLAHDLLRHLKFLEELSQHN